MAWIAYIRYAEPKWIIDIYSARDVALHLNQTAGNEI